MASEFDSNGRSARRHAAGTENGPAHWYHTCGLHVRSDIALPFDLLPDSAASELRIPVQADHFSASPECASEPDVTIRLGPVPETLPAGHGGRIARTDLWQARPGAFLMHVEGVARFLVTGGRDALIEPLGGGDDEVAAYFTIFPFTALLQQRGLLTLHSAAVATADGAVLLLGASGIGKSSLAMALVERGFPLLADDVTGVVLDACHRPVALPASVRLRLWAHTLDRMRWQGRALSPVHQGMEKYWMPAQRVCTEPLPVCAAFVLEAGSPHTPIDITPLTPAVAFQALWHHTHRKRIVDAVGRRPAHFRTSVAMARCTPVARVTRPGRPFCLEALAERIETAFLRG